MSPRLRFDGFELRPDSGELIQEGSPVKLQPQPLKVLEILTRRSGEVVSREEIRRFVWGDAFVDFDASLNFCIKEIRRALGDSAAEPRFIETLPRRGYRFLRPVEEAPGPAALSAPPEKAARRPWIALLSVALLAGLLLLLVGGRTHVTAPRLVVLPFECRNDDPEICGGLTEAVTAELARRFPKDVRVIAPDSARIYAGKSSSELARGLDATHVLSGEVEISGRQLRMAVRLAPSAGGEALWRDRVETDLGDAPLLYSQIVRGVARELHLPPPPAAGPRRHPKPSSTAYEAYLRGIYLLRRHHPVEATASLQNAVLLDPTFAEAYAALARALDGVEKPLCADIALIDTAARRALALDPDLAEAHLALAHSLFHCHFDWEGAGREFQRALALNPGNADTYHQYAFYLASLGRHGDAIASASQARELDPASMLVESDFAYFFYLGRRYGEAVRQARRALDLLLVSQEDPGVARFYRLWSLWVLSRSALAMGDEATALEASRGLRELSEGRILPAYFSAVAAMDSGHYGQALDALEEDCRTRQSFMLLFTGVDPSLEPLHGDPRFSRILDCLKMPADAPARTGRVAAPRGG